MSGCPMTALYVLNITIYKESKGLTNSMAGVYVLGLDVP
jgi:hypothetical protein